MKILVPVKRVVDPYVKIRVKPDESGVETQAVKLSMNPFDEIALEEALRLREKNQASEVIVVTIGSMTCQETLRHGLALGADKAILVKSDASFAPITIAHLLHHMVIQVQPQLVIMGKQSIDGDNNQTPQMLSALLNWPQATYASKVTLTDTTLEVVREMDGGLETVSMQLPAVISTDLRLNEPRYASLPNIMKSKSKPLEIIEADSLGVSLKKHSEVLSVKPPPTRSSGIKVTTVDELLQHLIQDKVL